MFADRMAAIKAVVADFSLVNVKFLKCGLLTIDQSNRPGPLVEGGGVIFKCW